MILQCIRTVVEDAGSAPETIRRGVRVVNYYRTHVFREYLRENEKFRETVEALRPVLMWLR